MDWDRFLAVEFWALVTMASMLAAAFSTAVSLLVRWNSRPEAEWAFRQLGRVQPTEMSKSVFEGRLVNIGDGYAFEVKIRGEACDPALYTERSGNGLLGGRAQLTFVPLIGPGEDNSIKVECEPKAWDQAMVIVEWTRSPTRRRKRRSKSMMVRNIAVQADPH